MKCVNTKGSEFKALAERNNVSINKLELIAHQYQIEVGDEENFPSDVYIQAKLGRYKYAEPSEAVRKLWNKNYRIPKEFNTLAEVQNAITEANRFFPEEAIRYHINTTDKYVLDIQQPVEMVPRTIDEFFNEGIIVGKHFDVSLDKSSRRFLSDIGDGNKRQFLFMKEEEVKTTLNRLVQESSLQDEEKQRVLDSLSKMSRKQILEELNLLQREQDDFALIAKKAIPNWKLEDMEVQEEIQPEEILPDDIQMSVSSSNTNTFTFADGKTIKTPFKLNSQQEDALKAMDAFAHSSEAVMTLSGYAGTGKTSLMEMFGEGIKSRVIRGVGRVVFTASTNKAAKVLKSKVKSKGFSAATFYRAFGYRLDYDPDAAEYNTNNKILIKINPKIKPRDIVVIDEASMIPDKVVDELIKQAALRNVKIIFVGDSAQLPPVEQDEISKVFKSTLGKVVELTKVERTGDNAILEEATRLRGKDPLSKESKFNSKGQGVAYIKSDNVNKYEDVIRHFLPKLNNNPEYFKILAYSNEKVTDFNDTVRSLLGYAGKVPQVGEPMVGYANWGYLGNVSLNESPYRFVNSESYKVVKVGNEETETQNFNINGIIVPLEFDVLPITLEDDEGKKDTFRYIDIKDNVKNLEAVKVLAKYKKQLWEDYRATSDKDIKGRILDTLNFIENYLFVNDTIRERSKKDPTKYVKIQDKVIDFGYAMTIHKSQGSTFTHILIDDIDIETKAKVKKKESFGNRANYDFEQDSSQGLAENDQDRANQDMNPIGEVRKFAGSFLERLGMKNPAQSTAATPSTQVSQSSQPARQTSQTNNTDIANLKQQLRYVAVSRATDTVTIISNDVKKEDSPLNHLEKQESIPQQTQGELHIEEPTTWTSKSGKTISGKYVGTESEGFIHINYEGSSQARIKVDANTIYSLHLNNEDIIGRKEDYNDSSLYEEVNAQLNEEGIYIESVTIRPNGEVYITLADGNGIIEGDTAYTIFRFMFPNAKTALREANFYFNLGRIRKANPLIRGGKYHSGPILLPKGVKTDDILTILREDIVGLLEEYPEIEYKKDIIRGGTAFGASGYHYTDVISTDSIKKINSYYGVSAYPTLWDLVDYATNSMSSDKAEQLYKDYPDLEGKIAKLILNKINGTGLRADKNQANDKKVENIIKTEGKDAVDRTIDAMQNGDNPLSPQEQKSAKKLLGTTRPKVVMASEHTDPVFHADKIVKMVEEELKKPAKERKFHMLQLMTKHDGLPLRKLLELKIPKTVHFSITSLGSTKWEPGVMKPKDLLDRIESFIKEGILPPGIVTIRIDPIIPGVTTEEGIRYVVERASKMGIRNFKFSIMDSYGYTDGAGRRDRKIIQMMERQGYDWDTYYGRDSYGVVNYDAKPEYMNAIYQHMEGLAEEFNIKFFTCGEKPKSVNGTLKNISFSVGCLNAKTVNATLGVEDVEDFKGNQRDGCSCYGGKIDALKWGDECRSSCVYCYAQHNTDAARKYYNEDGTLIDDIFTRVSNEKQNPEMLQQKETPMENADIWEAAANIPTPSGRRSITYTPIGKEKQTYQVEGKHIYNRHNIEVFDKESRDRNKIYVNLAVQEGRAVVVMHKGNQYVVNNKRTIVSVRTGDIMKWGEENGDRKAILGLAAEKFKEKLAKQPQQPVKQVQHLTITPAKSVDKKATAKGSISNKFIGFAEGIVGSSTAEYARQAGDKANVGEYNADDVVFVSIPGRRGDAEIRHREQNRTIVEALEALKAGATLITNNKAYTASSAYNEGEQALAKALEEAGAEYTDRAVGDTIIGQWRLPIVQQIEDVNTISPKTEVFGVTLVNGSSELKSSYQEWQRQHPEGIVAFRVNFNKYNTPEEALAGRIGNPFSEKSNGKDTVQQFYEWLLTGNNFGNTKATEEYRQAVIEKILATPNDAPVLYYKELGRPSHATILGYLIKNKHLLQQTAQSKQQQNQTNETKIKVNGVEFNTKEGAYYYGKLARLQRWIGYMLGTEVSKTKYWQAINETAEKIKNSTTIEEAKDLFNSMLKGPSKRIQEAINNFISGRYEGSWTQEEEDRAWQIIEREFSENQVQQGQQPTKIASQISNAAVEISTVGYRKEDPVNNKDTAYVFTENAQANAAALSLDDSWMEEGYPKGTRVKLDVSDVNGTNQAGVRARRVNGQTVINPNAFGIIVKKYQQDSTGRFIAEAGQFKDTDSDFELFKVLNNDMFDRLEKSGLKKIVFPSQMGKGKAALPMRFAEWLQKELENRFGIKSEISQNTRVGYNGYGLDILSVNRQNEQSRQQPSQTTKAVADKVNQQIRQQITKQLIDHIQSINIPVKFREAMIKRLKELADKGYSIESLKQAYEENQEMAAIRAEAIANGTFMLAPNGKKSNLTERQWLQVRTKAFKKWFGDWENDPANASKVVDENGEPLVVYHGTSRKLNNNTFATEFIFTSDNDIIGAGYGFQRKGFSVGIDYALSSFAGEDIILFRKHIEYLIKALENEIELGENMPFYQEGDLDTKKSLLKDLEDAKQEINNRDIFKELKFNIFDIFQNIKNPLIVDAKGKYWHSIEFESGVQSTDSLAKIAKSGGYDGLIIKNVIDKGAEVSKDGEYADAANDYVAFSPNQIKSATDNIGTFSTENDDIQMMMVGDKDSGTSSDMAFAKTPEGEVYGFIDPETKDMYLDETIISPEHPIHEYTHLWDRAVAERNPRLWARGVELMKKFLYTKNGKKISLWEEVENDPNYGQKWQKYKTSDPKRYEFLVASEVHAKLVGKSGQAFMEKFAQDNGVDNLIGKLKKWIADVWKALAETFGVWKKEDLDKLTLADFNHMTVRDLVNGTMLKGDKVMDETKTQVEEKPFITTIKMLDEPLYVPTKAHAMAVQKLYYMYDFMDEDKFEELVDKITNASNEELPMLERQIRLSPEMKRLWEGDKADIEEQIEEEAKTPYEAPKEKKPTTAPEDGTVEVEGRIEEDADAEEENDDDDMAPEPNPYEVSLTNYASYTGRSGDISVDSEWKVRELQELDKQINANNPKTQNTMLIDKIKAVLRCKDRSELKKALKNAEKLARYGEMNRQMDNLNKSDLLTSTQVRHAAEQIVDSISDMITKIQSEAGGAKELFPHLNIQRDLTRESRQEIVRTIGIDNFIQKAKENFNPQFNMRLEGRKDRKQAYLLRDNWDALMELGAASFVANEGFGIKKNYSKEGFSMAESMKLQVDETGHTDTDSIGEMKGDAQEHWQIEFRTVDILNSMSEIVRTALHKCYILDKDGNKKISKWGVPERVNKKEAVQSILKWTQGALTLDQMVDKLNERLDEAPWLTQLIKRLTDRTGNEANFQSQFFGVMNKHWQLYSIVRDKNGKFVCMNVNENPALKVMMNTLKAQIKLGTNPMFHTDGSINEENLKFLHQYYDELNGICKSIHEREQESKSKNFGKILGVELTEEERASAHRCLVAASRVLGFDIPEASWDYVVNVENVKTLTTKLGTIINRGFDMALKWNVKDYDPFAFKGEFSITGATEDFITPVAERMENTIASSFYSDGKMYQSYVIPSYMTKLMAKLRTKDPKALKKVLMEEYGKSEWFRKKGKADLSTSDRSLWRTPWLKQSFYDAYGEEPVLRHKVELNFNKHAYMRTMNDNEYALSLIAEYYSEQKSKFGRKVAWYRVPMLSNKPSSEFIRFYRFSKEEIIDGMFDIFCQELSRIQTVRIRNKSKGDVGYIKNFDENGRKFCFLPFLNQFLEENAKGRLAELLQEKVKSNKEMGDVDAELVKLVTEAIETHMEERTEEIIKDWERKGILKAAKKIEGIGKDENEVRERIEEFIWNDNFATKNILQLTIGDIAFYKDAEDLQKRLAQIHAPGTRANINATDYNLEGSKEAQRVSDGIYRTIILKDFDSFASNIIANISEVFDRRIARAKTEQEKKTLEAMKDALVRPPKTLDEKDKGGSYWNINVADAQGYSSPSSYRKKALMFGKWSREAERIYQDLLRGEYDYTSLQVAFQPLKPFVYSRIEKDMGVENAPITTMFSPFQAKNAEYLLIMADAMIRGEEKQSGKLSRPNLLRAVYEVMEDSAYDKVTIGKDGKKIREGYNRRGIDTVQFESAIKSSLQTPIDINDLLEDAEGEKKAYNRIRDCIYVKKTDKAGNRIYDEYDDVNYVQQALFEDYCLQQEVPEHFKEHEQAHGSQIRMITPADLDLYDNDNASHDDESNKVYYEWNDAKEGHRKVDAKKFREEYEKTIAENIEESLKTLSKELHLESENMKERNIILSEFLQREILDSPRYGTDLFLACSVDEETGKFRIPKGDPVQAKRIEQLINSLIKNRVNKQTIPGGPIVQVSNYGLSKKLHIRFQDKKGKKGDVILSEDEFAEAKKEGKYSEYSNYSAYCKERQGGIAYFECLAPIWSDDLVEKFGRPDGTIDIKAMKALDPELLMMVSYRIPTEDKYSCAPMKVVGFLPREAGEAIILPYELTGIDGSDFDVDKRYVMRKSIDIKVDWDKRFKKKNELWKKMIESYKKAHDGKISKEMEHKLWVEVEGFIENPWRFLDVTNNPLIQTMYVELEKMLPLKTVHPTEGKRYRDNKIIDMTLAVLTHEKSADKILNPGGFDEQKRMGYLISAYKNPANMMDSWEELSKLDVNALKKKSYVEKDLTWVDTQIHFYHQNNAGSSLIGAFAVNKVAHATLQDDDIYVALDEVCGEKPFSIAGFEFKGRKRIDPMYDINGNLVGKSLGSLVAASADTAKDPVLDLMNINMQTVAILTSMMRMGMPFENVALFLSQPIITEVLEEYNKRSLTSHDSLEKIVREKMNTIEESVGIDEHSSIHTEDVSKKDLIDGLRGQSDLETLYKVLERLLKMKALADAMRKVSFPTRFNSISSAVGPLIVDNLILERKMAELKASDSPFYDGKEDTAQRLDTKRIFDKHPILKQFSRTVDMTGELFMDMPTGSTRFRNFLENMEKMLGEDFANTIYRNRDLLDQLSIFFQSSMIINSGLVDESKLGYYIDQFPKEFFENKYKQKYADNALISRIEANTSVVTGRVFLQINTTGMEATEKDALSSAWYDLHKKDPKLAKQLFDYCFFRGGIGFTPKTFISLLNTYMKEALENPQAEYIVEGETKKGVTYVEVFDRIPQMEDTNIWDQFIRNNWDNPKLVRKVNLSEGDVVEGNKATFAGSHVTAPYIQLDLGDNITLWRKITNKKNEEKGQEQQPTEVSYEKVMPLGDNKEYIEISKSNISTPYKETTSLQSDEEDSYDSDYDDSLFDDMQFSMETNPDSMMEAEDDVKIPQSFTSQVKETVNVASKLVEGMFGESETSNEDNDLTVDKFSKMLDTTLEEKGVVYDKEEAKKETDKYC